MILLRGCNKIRQDWRVEFVCGGRAEAAARGDAELIGQVSGQLKCAPQDLHSAVERLLRESEALAKRLKALIPRVAQEEAAALLNSTAARANGIRVVAQLLENVESDYLQQLATELSRTENVVALLADKQTGSIVLAQNGKVGKDMNTLLKQMFAKYTGKGGGTRDFARGALSDPSKAAAALELAKGMI